MKFGILSRIVSVFIIFLLPGMDFTLLSGFPLSTSRNLFLRDADRSAVIKEDLLVLVNQEREKRGLSVLTSIRKLSRMAEAHSRDMAVHQNFSHVSFSGDTLRERLVKSDIYFRKSGENIAFSETYVSSLIHQGFMESSEHRVEILDPSYDRIGIGVVFLPEKGYYITQDFVTSIERMEVVLAEKKLCRMINEKREFSSLPSFEYLPMADRYARIMSSSRAQEMASPDVSHLFGETSIYNFASPSLEESEFLHDQLLRPEYNEAGLGAWFGRNEEYPGGAYFVTVLLFPENPLKKTASAVLEERLLSECNRVRVENKLKPLQVDKFLSKEARKIMRTYMMYGTKRIRSSPGISRMTLISAYTSDNPGEVPAALKDKMKNSKMCRIGLRIQFSKTPEYPRGTFWIGIVISP